MKDYTQLAKDAVNNWQEFEQYAWSERPDDAENWTIVTLETMNSTLDEQANARAMRENFAELFDETDVRFEYYGSNAGWINAICIRVYDSEGNITKAFERFCEQVQYIREHVLLNEDYYFELERISTIHRIYALVNDSVPEGLAEDWPIKVYDYMWENKKEWLNFKVNEGGFPSKENILETIEILSKADTLSDTNHEEAKRVEDL